VIIEVNTELSEVPQKINEDPYGEGWICVIEPADVSAFDGLLDASGYRDHVDG
jgi:glycine cleavage system H protein